MPSVFKGRIHPGDEYVLGDGNWAGKVIPKSLQWPCSIHSISISLSSGIFFFRNYHQLMTTNRDKAPENNRLREWIWISENGNLSWLTDDTTTINFITNSRPVTSSVKQDKLWKAKRGTLWEEGFPWHYGHPNGLLPFLSPVLLLF